VNKNANKKRKRDKEGGKHHGAQTEGQKRIYQSIVAKLFYGCVCDEFMQVS
jgi:hypothetical protein